MDKIVPKDIKIAYLETGIKPLIYSWMHVKEGKICGACAMTVLFAHKNGYFPSTCQPVKDWALTNFGPDYFGGFMDGWDGATPPEGRTKNDRYKEGLIDGRNSSSTIFSKKCELLSTSGRKPTI